MAYLPNIMPADPAAPESQTHTPRKLRYGMIGRIFLYFELARERRALAKLDDYLLLDIGMTRDAARRESRRPFWDVPKGWRTDVEQCLSRPPFL